MLWAIHRTKMYHVLDKLPKWYFIWSYAIIQYLYTYTVVQQKTSYHLCIILIVRVCGRVEKGTGLWAFPVTLCGSCPCMEHRLCDWFECRPSTIRIKRASFLATLYLYCNNTLFFLECIKMSGQVVPFVGHVQLHLRLWGDDSTCNI